MEKIKDFFREIGERLSNPLIGSFLISWGVINWKVIIGFLFYNLSELPSDGYKSYIDLVEQEHSFFNFLLFPLFGSLAYTFLFPVIRIWIQGFNAWVNSWGSRWVFRISKNGYVKIEKYMSIKHEFDIKTIELQEVMKKEGELLRSEKLKDARIMDLENVILKLEDNLKNWRQVLDNELIVGEWNLRFKKSEKLGEEKIFRVNIQKQNIYFDDNPPYNLSQSMTLRLFQYEPENGIISFLAHNPTSDERTLRFFSFKAIDNFGVLKGYLDEKFQIEMQRNVR